MLPEPDGINPQNPAPPLVPLHGPVAVPSSVSPLPSRGVVGRHGHAPPPALNRGPTGMLLLKSLGRRWLLAASVGLLLAGLAGGGTFYFLPPPEHTVRTLIYAPPNRGIVFKQTGSIDLSHHQRTQAAMLRSRLVLNSVYAMPRSPSSASSRSKLSRSNGWKRRLKRISPSPRRFCASP